MEIGLTLFAILSLPGKEKPPGSSKSVFECGYRADKEQKGKHPKRNRREEQE
jgi:hypothetical protein